MAVFTRSEETFLKAVYLEPLPLQTSPDMDSALKRQSPQEGGFTGSVFPDKKRDRRVKPESGRLLKNLQVKGIVVSCWKAVRCNCN